jgi:hypothetical protein
VDALVFLALVGVVAIAGVGTGLLLAPRLTAWDDRRARSAEAGDERDVNDDGAGPPAGAAEGNRDGGGEDD